MRAQLGHNNRFIWIGVGLTLALLLLSFLLTGLRLRALRSPPLPVYGQVADFTLINQNGRAVTLDDLRGHVWVSDIIFTRCAGPCLKMSRSFKDLQDSIDPSSQVRLVSLTTDPDYDTPPVLARYAQRFGANPDRWMFLTGTKKQIASLATDSLKLTAIEKKPEERENAADLFIHSTILVIVDKRAQVRGVYQTSGEGVDPVKTRADILAAVGRLERE